jgi:hypothetical protein
MKIPTAAFAALFLATAQAATVPNLRDLVNANTVSPRASGSNNCNFTTWNKVSAELQTLFTLGSGRLCNDDARAAIRLVFHDCGTWSKDQGSTGGCDGSLVLNDAELARGENGGLAGIAAKIRDLATKYSVPKADMVVFAGSKPSAFVFFLSALPLFLFLSPRIKPQLSSSVIEWLISASKRQSNGRLPRRPKSQDFHRQTRQH